MPVSQPESPTAPDLGDSGRDNPGPLELLVLQPTPFCNLDCAYCYLPDRTSTRHMERRTVQAIARWVFGSGLVRRPFTVLWHAGEPFVVARDFYEDAFAILQEHNREGIPLCHSFQTNGTLIDADWCAFCKRHEILLGVSIDGPAFLHDRLRTTRQGRGTWQRVRDGIALLRAQEVPFHVITVLTDRSLDYPDELFDFYWEQGIDQVAFNIEEIEGPHTRSSLRRPEAPARYARFLRRFLDLAVSADPPLGVRELGTMLAALRHPCVGALPQEVNPFAIVNIDCEGNFATFSPELLGLSGEPYGEFALGNVARDSLGEVLRSPHYRKMADDVALGVSRCRQTCSYFPVCGGVAPANKFFEHGTFDTTETLFCKFTRQIVLDVVLDGLERERSVPTERGNQRCPSG
jgi:uncharacterized protein